MKKIRFNWTVVVVASWFAILFALVITAVITRKTNDSPFAKQRLKDDETLIIWFREPIEERLGDNPDLSITNDEINWFCLEQDWFIIDYKYDPGTYYINNNYILTWGIER